MGDLHVHTTASDGCLSPGETVLLAAQASLSTIAITDHDTLAGLSQAREQGVLSGVRVLQGVELSTKFNPELHLLGYGVDENNMALNQALEAHRANRRDRFMQMRAILAEMGMPVPDAPPTQSPGRAHLARELTRLGFTASMADAFKKYLNPGCRAYIPRQTLSPTDGIRLIRRAGGVPVLAHPGLMQLEETTLIMLVESLCADGLEGIETHHPSHRADQSVFYTGLTARLNLCATFGSDFHGDRTDLPYQGLGCVQPPNASERINDLLSRCQRARERAGKEPLF